MCVLVCLYAFAPVGVCTRACVCACVRATRSATEIQPSVLLAVRVVDVSPGPAQLQELMLGRLLPREGLEPLVRQHSAVQKELRTLQECVREEQVMGTHAHLQTT